MIENKARQARQQALKEDLIQKNTCTFKPKLLTKRYNEDLRNLKDQNAQVVQKPEDRLLAWAAARDAKRNALK